MEDKSGIAFGLCLLLGFVGVGYMFYQWIGGYSLLIVSIFIFATTTSYTAHTKYIVQKAEKEAVRKYERTSNRN